MDHIPFQYCKAVVFSYLKWKREDYISLFVDKTIEKSSSQWSKLHGNSEYPSNAKRVNKETLISDDDERV